MTSMTKRAMPAPRQIATMVKQGRYHEVAELMLQVCEEGESVTGPSEIGELLVREIGRKRREMFAVVALDVAHKVIKIEIVTTGLLSRTVVDPREVFRSAIIADAACLIIAHNHPSGRLEPSIEDLDITRRLKQAGEVLGIPVLDHFIVNGKAYKSMLEYGLF